MVFEPRFARYRRTSGVAGLSTVSMRNMGSTPPALSHYGKFRIPSRNRRYGARYQPTGEQGLEEAVRSLNEDPQALTFIDLGCGKGRTLLVASVLGFKRIIGVEFARELVLIARENLSKRNVLNADVIHGDAADFQFPDDNFVLISLQPLHPRGNGASRCKSDQVSCKKSVYLVCRAFVR